MSSFRSAKQIVGDLDQFRAMNAAHDAEKTRGVMVALLLCESCNTHTQHRYVRSAPFSVFYRCVACGQERRWGNK